MREDGRSPRYRKILDFPSAHTSPWARLAWAAHSSVAVALLVMSFTEKGVVPLNAALALIVGANIGTTLNPLLEGVRG
jgi:Na+/Pi-cotransporter